MVRNSITLHQAAWTGDEATVRTILSRSKVNADTSLALTYAAYKGHDRIVRLLLCREDVNPNATEPNDEATPLLYAARNGHEAVVRLLLGQSGVDVDVNFRSDRGRTPIWWAAAYGHGGIVGMLLSRKDIEPEATDTFSLTPLMIAAKQGHKAVVQLLLDRDDVSPEFRSHHGLTALLLAEYGGHEAIVRLLTNNSRHHRSCRGRSVQDKIAFNKRKDTLARKFLERLDNTVTGGKIAAMTASTGGVRLVWNKNLRTTAGFAKWRKKVKSTGRILRVYACIELSERVVDDDGTVCKSCF